MSIYISFFLFQIAVTNNSRAETTRVKHLSQINKLESEIRSLEVTVTTLGNFISTLAYGKTDIEIPNDVLRILSQLNMAERRRSLPKTSLSDLGSDSDSLNNITLGQARSLPPKTASSYFAKSFDQIRQQKMGVLSNELIVNKNLPETQLTKSLSDARNLKFDRILEESTSTDRSQSLGRVLNTHEMETLKQFQKNYRRNELSPETPKRPPPLKVSKSSFELTTPGVNMPTIQDCENSPYPLNCGGVQISYRGTRILKSLSTRPTRTRSDLHIEVPKGLTQSNDNVTSLINGDDHGKDENCNKSVDSAFDESVESIESENTSITEKTERVVNAVQESKISVSDNTVS